MWFAVSVTPLPDNQNTETVTKSAKPQRSLSLNHPVMSSGGPDSYIQNARMFSGTRQPSPSPKTIRRRVTNESPLVRYHRLHTSKERSSDGGSSYRVASARTGYQIREQLRLKEKQRQQQQDYQRNSSTETSPEERALIQALAKDMKCQDTPQDVKEYNHQIREACYRSPYTSGSSHTDSFRTQKSDRSSIRSDSFHLQSNSTTNVPNEGQERFHHRTHSDSQAKPDNEHRNGYIPDKLAQFQRQSHNDVDIQHVPKPPKTAIGYVHHRYIRSAVSRDNSREKGQGQGQGQEHGQRQGFAIYQGDNRHPSKTPYLNTRPPPPPPNQSESARQSRRDAYFSHRQNSANQIVPTVRQVIQKNDNHQNSNIREQVVYIDSTHPNVTFIKERVKRSRTAHPDHRTVLTDRSNLNHRRQSSATRSSQQVEKFNPDDKWLPQDHYHPPHHRQIQDSRQIQNGCQESSKREPGLQRRRICGCEHKSSNDRSSNERVLSQSNSQQASPYNSRNTSPQRQHQKSAHESKRQHRSSERSHPRSSRERARTHLVYVLRTDAPEAVAEANSVTNRQHNNDVYNGNVVEESEQQRRQEWETFLASRYGYNQPIENHNESFHSNGDSPRSNQQKTVTFHSNHSNNSSFRSNQGQSEHFHGNNVKNNNVRHSHSHSNQTGIYDNLPNNSFHNNNESFHSNHDHNDSFHSNQGQNESFHRNSHENLLGNSLHNDSYHSIPSPIAGSVTGTHCTVDRPPYQLQPQIERNDVYRTSIQDINLTRTSQDFDQNANVFQNSPNRELSQNTESRGFLHSRPRNPDHDSAIDLNLQPDITSLDQLEPVDVLEDIPDGHVLLENERNLLNRSPYADTERVINRTPYYIHERKKPFIQDGEGDPWAQNSDECCTNCGVTYLYDSATEQWNKTCQCGADDIRGGRQVRNVWSHFF